MNKQLKDKRNSARDRNIQPSVTIHQYINHSVIGSFRLVIIDHCIFTIHLSYFYLKSIVDKVRSIGSQFRHPSIKEHTITLHCNHHIYSKNYLLGINIIHCWNSIFRIFFSLPLVFNKQSSTYTIYFLFIQHQIILTLPCYILLSFIVTFYNNHLTFLLSSYSVETINIWKSNYLFK